MTILPTLGLAIDLLAASDDRRLTKPLRLLAELHGLQTPDPSLPSTT